MFTGIITHQGTVKATKHKKGIMEIELFCPKLKTKVGASIAVNGVCLTVAAVKGSARLIFEVVAESLSRSTLSNLKPKMRVNLEQSTKLNERLDGHMVMGHVDGIGTLTKIATSGENTDLTFNFPPSLKPFFATKGSIAIDGVSLTITDVKDKKLTVTVIPHTLKVTTLGSLQVGGTVNLEVDVIARYVQNNLTQSA